MRSNLLLERQAEDLAFLWIWRRAMTAAPNGRLADLVRLDERLDAFCDSLSVTLDSAGAIIARGAGAFDGGGLFARAAVSLAIGSGGWLQQLSDLASAPADGRGGALSPMISALARTERGVATAAVGTLRKYDQAVFRAVAVAVEGARRMDTGPVLAPMLANHSALVRPRAYRTTGQLGRADLMAQLRPGFTDADPECRFWSAWAAARMGAGEEALNVLADVAWNNLPRADRALDLLLRRLDVPQANSWLREFAKLPDRHRDLIRATGVIGDPLYIPWLIEHMVDNATARLAGEAFSMITGLDLAYRDLDRKPPADFESGPNDDPEDENVALDEDEHLPWPDPARIGTWWAANRARFSRGTAYFLGTPKENADWLEALSDAFQRQRHAAALELAIRQPEKAMFEVRARGRLQRQMIARARGLA